MRKVRNRIVSAFCGFVYGTLKRSKENVTFGKAALKLVEFRLYTSCIKSIKFTGIDQRSVKALLILYTLAIGLDTKAYHPADQHLNLHFFRLELSEYFGLGGHGPLVKRTHRKLV